MDLTRRLPVKNTAHVDGRTTTCLNIRLKGLEKFTIDEHAFFARMLTFGFAVSYYMDRSHSKSCYLHCKVIWHTIAYESGCVGMSASLVC